MASQFQARGNRSRDTITPARNKPSQFGLSPYSAADIFEGKAGNFSGLSNFGLIGQGLERGIGFGVETVAEGLHYGGYLLGSGMSQRDQSDRGGGPKRDMPHQSFGESPLGRLFVTPKPQAAPTTPADTITSTVNDVVDQTQSVKSDIDIQQQLENVPLPFAARQALEQKKQETQDQLAQISTDLANLESQQTAIQDNFDFGTALLEAQGLPATVQSAREDPTIAAALDKVDLAISDGDTESLNAAIDAMSSLGEDTLDLLGEAFGRDQYLAQMQTSIRNQMHNLVQNRQNVEQNLIDYEDWLNKEAQAQELNLWDFQGDPTPSGRGFDTLMNDVGPWLESTYQGLITDSQWSLMTQALDGIWQSSLNDNPIQVLDEKGNPTGEVQPRPDLTPEQEQGLIQLATAGTTDAQGNLIPGLGLTQAQAIDFVEKVKAAITRGRKVTDQVDNWSSADFLEPGSAALGAAIYQVAEDLYQDPEVADQMAKSDFMHRLIMMRSNGDVNFHGGGNQFGLGGLPEHTYEQMGYNMQDLENNPELQMEALLTYIGYWQYGPGYEGLQAAVSDMMHNPNTWGDIG